MSDDTRPFGFWTATALVIGGVIGAGIFVLPSQMAGFGWTGVAAWLLGGAGAIVIARVLASVAEARPEEPGLMAVIGEVLGPVPGVLNGWGAWVSYWCANAYIALTSVRYASDLWPFLATTPFHLAVAAAVLIAGLTTLNLLGLKASGRFQVVTTLLKLVPLVAVMLILAGLLLGGGEAFTREAHAPFQASSLFAATALAFVAIIGFESASIAAQRVRNPERNVPRATMVGVPAELPDLHRGMFGHRFRRSAGDAGHFECTGRAVHWAILGRLGRPGGCGIRSDFDRRRAQCLDHAAGRSATGAGARRSAAALAGAHQRP